MQQECINEVRSLPRGVGANIRVMIMSMCKSEVFDNFYSRPFPECAEDCVNILSDDDNGTAIYENPVECLSDCPKVVLPNSSTISSPNYPENYPNAVLMYYVVIAPEGQKIDISFNYFDIEDDIRCLYDWLIIIDGDGTELLPRSCGSEKPELIKTQSNQATIIFYSDSSFTSGGFQADLSDGVQSILYNLTDTRRKNKMLLKTDTRLNPIQLANSWGVIRKPNFNHTRGRYPWICSIRSKHDKRHYCGTTILSRPPGPLVMVTAAHCVHLCKSEDGNTRPNCCCNNVSGVGCSAESQIDCGVSPSVEVMTGKDTEVICGEWETGNFTAKESGEEYNIILGAF